MDISLQNIEYRYQANTPFERLAIKDVSIDIPTGTYMAINWPYRFRKINCFAAFKCLVNADRGNGCHWST